ncbi:hypothetical protein ACTOB_003612 [Actinoplanes oblitus]|uniref:Uncharacterized protein n=1 Tax=Actinoplanes oblitus TaxID=3040509 RepID=A0ABY8WT27_9ACTN|nr:hypothetical protein [Actinoplanes oblitus]WIM99942.1 hypothetical protein ACTOB_003612 [Actinoplanes oblitus]
MISLKKIHTRARLGAVGWDQADRRRIRNPVPWTADYLIGALTSRSSTLFPELERVARAKGFGDVLDAWDDLDVDR